MKTAVIYCRVSTEDQEREGTSLDSQREACLAKANELGYEVPDEYILVEVYSGLSLERPRLDELREWIKHEEIEALVVYSTDRLSRDPVHLLLMADECEKAKVNLCFVTEPLDNSMEGQLLGFVRGWSSKLEVIKIRERCLRGKRSRAKEGRIVCGGKLYGYDYAHGKRYINEQESQWVRAIFRWYVEEGLSLHKLAYRLMSLGVPSPSGKKQWCIQTLHHMLKQQAYIGKTFLFTQSYIESEKHYKPKRRTKFTHRVYKPQEEWIELPDATPAIISEDLFNQAQEKLHRHWELAPRNTKLKYLLSGYLFCHHCGRRYVGKFSKYSTKTGMKFSQYYHCPKNHRVFLNRCSNSYWNAEHIEGLVWRNVEAVLKEPEVVLAGLETLKEDNGGSLGEDLEMAKDQLKQLGKRQEELLDWALKGFPEETVVKENKKINDYRIGLQKRKAELEAQTEQARQSQASIEDIKKACEIVSNNLCTLSYEEKRLALEALDIKVWLDNEKVTIKGAIPISSCAIASNQSGRGW